MQLYYFSNPIRSFLRIFILIFLTGCGSYQYSSIMTEDIYETIENVSPQTTQSTASTNTQSSYYQNAFSEKSNEYAAVNNENDVLFTDADEYTDSSVENDSTNNNYGPWGDNKTNVTINMIGGQSMYNLRGSRSNYPSWLMNYGYGYGNVFGYGVNSWGFGYDMYWTKPYWNNFHNGLFYPYWNNMGYGYGGYGYGYGGWPGNGWYGGYSFYNNYYRNNNTNVAYISGRRGSSNLTSRSNFSSRASNNNYTNQSSISDNMINSNLRDRTSRIETLNQTLVTKPSYYSKPSSSLNTSNSKPSNWRPSNSNSNSKPSYNNSNNNSKPSYNNSNSNSKPSNNSRPSFNSSSSSRSVNSSSSTSSRGGKGGGN